MAEDNVGPMNVSPEVLLTQIVQHIGEDFVVISMDGWMQIVGTIQKFSEDNKDNEGNILEMLEELGIPVVPVSLSNKDDESKIIMPDDVPQGESRIIMP